MKKKKIKNSKLKNNLIIFGVIAAAFIAAVVIYFVSSDKEKTFDTTEYNESLSLNGEVTTSLIWNTKGLYPKYSEEYDYYFNFTCILDYWRPWLAHRRTKTQLLGRTSAKISRERI